MLDISREIDCEYDSNFFGVIYLHLFINLLTEDDNIRVGHDLDSQTTDVSTSVWLDETTGLSVTLIDTPGFDDSRSDITDTDILIATFLQER